MLTRRRNHLTRVLNEAALALIDEARRRPPADAAALADLATRIDQTRVGLLAEPRHGLAIDHAPLPNAA